MGKWTDQTHLTPTAGDTFPVERAGAHGHYLAEDFQSAAAAATHAALTTGAHGMTAFGASLVDDANAAAARTTLGLGTAALSASGDFQAADAELAAIAGLTSAADKGIQFTGVGTAATFDLTAAGKALLDDADASAQRTTLGLGTAALSASGDFQAADAELAAIAGLVSAADRLPYFTGLGTADLATFTAAGRAIVDDADATAQRATLGLGTAALAATGDFAAASHAHAGEDVTSGTVAAARLGEMTGDAGAGGAKGAVPAPAAGDAAAGKFLKADKTWAVPPSGGNLQKAILGTGIDSAARLYTFQQFTAGSLTHTLTANKLYLIPFIAPSGVKVKKLLARVVAGVGSAQVKLGLYSSNSNGMPTGAPIVESGNLDGATAPANISYTPGASVALTAGSLYWAAIVSDSAVGIRGTSTYLIEGLVGITEAGISSFAFHTSARADHTYGALPSTPTAGMIGVANSSTIALIFMELEAA